MSDDWRAETVEKLRSLLVRAEPDLVEEAKWRKASNPDGVPTFSCDGLICTVETYQGQDQADLRPGRRAIDLHEGETLDEDAFVELVREAVAHNRS